MSLIDLMVVGFPAAIVLLVGIGFYKVFVKKKSVELIYTPFPKWWEQLPNISVPTLIIGGQSSHIPQNKLQEASELIPNCKLVTIEDAGHFVHDDNLPAFLTAVKDFLQK